MSMFDIKIRVFDNGKEIFSAKDRDMKKVKKKFEKFTMKYK